MTAVLFTAGYLVAFTLLNSVVASLAQPDYIIIGGGPAGYVLTEQLSRDSTKQVVLLEAGPDSLKSTTINTPAYYIQLQEPFWNYTAIPDPNLNGRSPNLGQARLLGGGSAVNGMAYCRGAASVFDEWAELSGNPGLAWNSLLEDFLETSHLGIQEADYEQYINSTVYGNGPLEVSRSSGLTGFENSFISALKSELGLGEADLNDGTGIGIDLGIAAIRAQFRTRSSARNTFGVLIDQRPNVRVISGAWVSSIGFSGNTATNVTYHTNSGNYTIPGTEIIVSGGAINTPKLLMLSGIGPKEHLEALKIPVVADIADVGANLRDHAFAIVELLVAPEVLTTWQWSVNATERVLSEEQYTANASGPLGWNNGFVFAEFRLPDSTWDNVNGTHFKELPADRPHVLVEFTTAPFLPTDNASAVALWVSLVQPEDSGHVALSSSNYQDDPFIYTNYYGSDADKAAIIAGYKALLSIVSRPEVGQLTDDRFYPSPAMALDSDDEVWAAIQQQTFSFRHPVGTVALGKALNSDWRLTGLKGIRVVDSSVFPFPTTCHPQAVVYALANRAAKDIQTADAGGY